VFDCAVYHQGIELGRGRGRSKKIAEGHAASAALARLRGSRRVNDQGEPGTESP
jgi:dsRNA-specific ribonuclease